jgi:hypothetical protein
MFCTNCGSENPDTGYFCVKCGMALTAQPGPVVLPAPAPSPTPVAPPISPVPPTFASNIPASAYSNEPPPAFTRPPETSGKAIGSLISGLLAWIFPAAVVAIVLGHLALSEINKSAGRIRGRGMAIAGLVLGYGGVLIIPVILIVAAIAIPNLLRARQAANEAAAVGSLRIMNMAAVSYAATYGNGFPPTVDALGAGDSGAANCDHAQLLDESLVAGEKRGYQFVYFLEPNPAGPPALSPAATSNGCTVAGGSMYEIHADPINRGNTGTRSFYTDQTGIIRYDAHQPATADSEYLGSRP